MCFFSLRIETQIELSNWTSDRQAIDGHHGVQKTMNNLRRGFASQCHVATPCNFAVTHVMERRDDVLLYS